MSFDTTVLQQLSAYIDNELPENEKADLEEALRQSPSLREELTSLQRTRDAVAGIKPLPEDAYFESRLVQRLKDEGSAGKRFPLRKPVIAFASVTLIVMALFKLQPDFITNLIHERSSDLKNLYAKNFKPLLYATALTNDDILNFAVNKALPLNREANQYLSLGTGKNGEQIIEVKTAGVSAPNVTVGRMETALSLDSRQTNRFHTILQNYADKVAASVLVNEKSTVAVNPSLWNYHDLLRQELLAFLAEANPAAARQVLAGHYPGVRSGNTQIPEPKNTDNFYCITPDTIFLTSLDIDRDKIMLDIKARRTNQPNDIASVSREIKIHIRKSGAALTKDTIISGEMRIFNHPDGCSVVINHPFPQGERAPEVVELPRMLDHAFNQIRVFAFNSEGDGSVQGEVRVQLPGSPDGKRFDKSFRGAARLPKGASLDSLMRGFHNQFSDSEMNAQPFGQGIPQMRLLDSLQKMFHHYFDDSSYARYPGELRQGMEDFKKEFEYMKKEFEKFRDNFQNQEKKKKVIEIKYQYDI